MSHNPAGHDYWYTDKDMHALLSHNLREAGVSVLAPIVLQAHNNANHQSLMESNIGALIEHTDMANTTAVMPVHLDGNHWAGISMSNVGGRLVASYIDPLRHPPHPDLTRSFHNLGIELDNVGDRYLRQQRNGHDCGVWVVEDLTHLAQHPGTLPDIEDVAQRREQHRSTRLIGGDEVNEARRRSISRKRDELRDAEESLDRRRDRFAGSFVECERRQKEAIDHSDLKGERGRASDDHTSRKAEQLNSLAKLLVYKGPYIAVAEGLDENCTVSFPNQTDGELVRQQGNVEDLKGTLRAIQANRGVSSRDILGDALDQGNVKALGVVKITGRTSRDRDVQGAVDNIADDVGHGRPVTAGDLTRVFPTDRAAEVFFSQRDIDNVHELLQGKDIDRFIRVLDTRDRDRRLCHVELNAIEPILDEAQARRRPIDIGLGIDKNTDVGCCGSCTVVLDVLERERGVEVRRTQDFPANYPHALYPYPKYLTETEQKEVVRDVSHRLRDDPTRDRDFEDARDKFKDARRRLDADYDEIVEKKEEIADLTMSISGRERRVARFESAGREFEAVKQSFATHEEAYREIYKAEVISRTVARQREVHQEQGAGVAADPPHRPEVVKRRREESQSPPH